jgi:hypothetical protein
MTPINQQRLIQFLIMVFEKAGLAAASVIIVALIAGLSHFDVTAIPVAYQAMVVFILPVIVNALEKLKLVVDADEAAKMASKQLASKDAELSDAKMALVEAKAMKNLPDDPKPPVSSKGPVV